MQCTGKLDPLSPERFPFYSASILASGSDDIAKALLKGGIIPRTEPAPEEESKASDTPEQVIEDLNMEINENQDEEGDESKQSASVSEAGLGKSRNSKATVPDKDDCDMANDVGEEGSLNST